MAAVDELYERWANACRVLGEGGTIGTGAVVVLTGGGERKLDVEKLTGLSWEEVISLLSEKQKGWKVFTGLQKKASSL